MLTLYITGDVRRQPRNKEFVDVNGIHLSEYRKSVSVGADPEGGGHTRWWGGGGTVILGLFVNQFI